MRRIALAFLMCLVMAGAAYGFGYMNTDSATYTQTIGGVTINIPAGQVGYSPFMLSGSKLKAVDINGVYDPNNASVSGDVKMIIGTVYTPGRYVKINSGYAGTFQALLADGSTTVIMLTPGTTVMPLSAKEILSNSATGAAFEIWK